MKKVKEGYSAPVSRVLGLTLEEVICASGNDWRTQDLPGFDFDED
jgi:hypothetical protein